MHDTAKEIAWRERWLAEPEDSIAWLTLKPKIEAELAALKEGDRFVRRCTKCGKSWRGTMARRYFDHAAERCAGYSTCAERARNAAGRKQGARA